MKKTVFLMILTLFMSLGYGCTPQKATRTQLQTRLLQTKTYETTDYKMVMKAVLNTLQDQGYIVTNAISNLGVITAYKMKSRFAGGFFSSPWVNMIDCSVNVTVYGNKTKVRVNFLLRVLNDKGVVTGVSHLNDPEYYKQFFSKVDKGVFLEKEGL